jgi:CRP-like cAMP-binding protein
MYLMKLKNKGFWQIKPVLFSIKENDLVFKQGEQGDNLFLVLQGQIGLFRLGIVKAAKGRVSLKEDIEKHIINLNLGTVFGEVSMLTESKRNVTAQNGY